MGDIDISESIGSSNSSKEPPMGAIEEAYFLPCGRGMNPQKSLKKWWTFFFKLFVSYENERSRGIFFGKKKKEL